MDASASSEASPDSIAKTSFLFCDPNADVTFISSDGVKFKIHSKYFACASAGFAAPDFKVDDELVALTESAEVLETLFQFIHPPSEYQQLRQPPLTDLEVKLFFAVATAAEKYVVYSAMNICVARMRYILYMSHPVEVLNHAANHGYADLMDLSAPKTIALENPFGETLAGLSNPEVTFKWLKYYGHWTQVPKFAHNLFVKSNYSSCSRVSEANVELLRNLTVNLTKIDPGTPKTSCTTAIPRNSYTSNCGCHKINDWVNLIKDQVAAIPRFSQL